MGASSGKGAAAHRPVLLLLALVGLVTAGCILLTFDGTGLGLRVPLSLPARAPATTLSPYVAICLAAKGEGVGGDMWSE